MTDESDGDRAADSDGAAAGFAVEQVQGGPRVGQHGQAAVGVDRRTAVDVRQGRAADADGRCSSRPPRIEAQAGAGVAGMEGLA